MKRQVFWTSVLALLLAAGAGLGCTARNLYPDSRMDPLVIQRAWTLQTHGPLDAGDKGAEYSHAAVVDNTLVFGAQQVGLVSLYPAINQQRWVLPIKGGVASELAIDRGYVYFGGADGFLYCVSLDNGRVSWRYEVRNTLLSRPTVSGGRLFVTTADDTVYAFDAGTGKWLWHYRRRSSQVATMHGASAPLVDGNEVLVGLSDGFLVALSLQEGALKWERRLHSGTKFTDVDAQPVLNNSTLYVPSYDGALYALKRAGGETLWRFDAGGSKQVLLEDRFLYLPSSDGSIYALQAANAKVIWKFEMDQGVPTRLAMTEKYLIVGSSHQYLYVLDKTNGKLLSRFNAGQGSGFYGAPVYDPATKKLFALSQAGNLYAFTVRDGKRRTRPLGQPTL